MSDPRVLSLIASATEIVCALGYRDRLVGRSHECDFPADVGDLPVATAPRIDVDVPSGEIDAQVKAAVLGADPLDALGVYEVRLEVLESLQPTHVITQTQCEVCAVSLRDVESALRQLPGIAPELVPLAPNSLDDVLHDVARVARAIGSEADGDRLVGHLRGRMGAVARAARRLDRRPGVALIEWVDPLMAGGNWMPELVEMAGGENLFGAAGRHSPWMEWEQVRDADPNIIVIAPCGFPIERTLEDLPILESQPGWRSLRAVRRGRVFVADGNWYFNRPGPRLAETLEILAEMIHPDEFDFGHRGRGWRPVATESVGVSPR